MMEVGMDIENLRHLISDLAFGVREERYAKCSVVIGNVDGITYELVAHGNRSADECGCVLLPGNACLCAEKRRKVQTSALPKNMAFISGSADPIPGMEARRYKVNREILRDLRVAVVFRLCLIADQVYDFGLSARNRVVEHVATRISCAFDWVALAVAPRSYLNEKATYAFPDVDVKGKVPRPAPWPAAPERK